LALPDAEPAIVRQILNYFVRNRSAADSLEGVARWRLLEEQIQRSLQQTDVALKWLVAKGYLEEITPAGSVPLFRLAPDHQAEALKFLQEQDRATKRRGAVRKVSKRSS
jgi:hypothetical protein